MASQLAMRLPVLPSVATAAVDSDIREATESDNEALAELLGSAFPELAWDADRVTRELTGLDEVLAVYVMERDGKLVATAAVRYWPDRFPGEGFLAWVGVSPAYQNHGLGTAIVVRTIQRFSTEKLWPVILETDDERLPAISSYLGLGFIPCYLDSDHESRWSTVFANLSKSRRRN